MWLTYFIKLFYFLEALSILLGQELSSAAPSCKCPEKRARNGNHFPLSTRNPQPTCASLPPFIILPSFSLYLSVYLSHSALQHSTTQHYIHYTLLYYTIPHYTTSHSIAQYNTTNFLPRGYLSCVLSVFLVLYLSLPALCCAVLLSLLYDVPSFSSSQRSHLHPSWAIAVQRGTKCMKRRGGRDGCQRTQGQGEKSKSTERRTCTGYPAYNPKNRPAELTIPIAPRPQEDATSSAASSSSSASSPLLSQALGARKPTIQGHKPRNPPPTPTSATRLTFYRPNVGLPFNTQEGQYFQIFRTHTANELSGFFDSEFWTRSVLQESHGEASVRHAVVALGALYKTLETATESPPGSPDNSYPSDTAPNHFSFALQQYGKALTRLREDLEANEYRSQRTVLISIVLFTCFQSFTGDHKAAIFQIQSGLGLLEERRQERKRPFWERQEDVVEDELVQMFTRLAIQAKSYDMAFHFPPPYVIRLSPSPNPSSPQSPSSSSEESSATIEALIPDIFTSVREARSALDSLCERILRFNEALSSFYAGPNNILPASIKSSGVGFKNQLEHWSNAFDPILQKRRSYGTTNTERAAINVLKSFQLMSAVLFLMGFSTSEMPFDGFIAEFRFIVELAKEVVVDEELSLAQARCGTQCQHRQNRPHTPHVYRPEDSYTHIKPSFALDLGIVPPLFVVATKCRDRKLRREAISLLISSPRREGMWDSILSARVASWIMEIEEEDLSPYVPATAAEIILDKKRVMVKEILFDMQSREATLRCGTRGARDGEKDDKAKETHVFW
ncbi:hypothetical protein B7494_g5084 [Chlorociboria aeruginascens]|nr:hypothetical protein B7494_g5084 [Chlorociboria aeruginascens]